MSSDADAPPYVPPPSPPADSLGAPAPGSPSGRATAALVVSIVGLAASLFDCCYMPFWLGFPLDVTALVLAMVERAAIFEGRSPEAGLQQANIARILSIIGLAIVALYIAFIVIVLVIGVGGAALGPLIK